MDQLQTWEEQIDRNTQRFKETFGGLAEADLNWKPAATVWSIGQNIDHLMVINKTYWPVLDAVRKGTYQLPWIGKFEWYANFIGKFILKSTQPDRRSKIKTIPIWEPSNSNITADVLDRFEKHQSDLKQLIRDSEDLLSKGTVISSPANKNIVYKLSTAFDIIIVHEQRHYEQAKEVLGWLKSK